MRRALALMFICSCASQPSGPPPSTIPESDEQAVAGEQSATSKVGEVAPPGTPYMPPLEPASQGPTSQPGKRAPAARALRPPAPPAAVPAAGAGKVTHTLTEGLTTQEEIRARMKKVAASLGVKCSHCHDTSDFEAPTNMKNVANLMWDRMVVGLKTTDGADLTCEHCHQGKAKFLDRSDKEALKAWMKANFVDKLAPRDGSKMECDTCHRGARWEFLPRG